MRAVAPITLVDLVLVRVAVALVVVDLVVRVASCGYGLEVFGASDEGVDEAVAVAVDLWGPEVEEVADRLDVFVVDDDSIRAVSHCNTGDRRISECAFRPGSALVRARVYSLEGYPVPANVLHGLQHFHLWGDRDTNACASHSVSCGWIDVDLDDAGGAP